MASLSAATCPTHPEQAALGACARCGAFVCALDSRLVEGQRYCQTCAARPDVDWLDAYRLQHWGRRDGWAWLMGISAPLQVVSGIAGIVDSGFVLIGVLAIGSGLAAAAWWLGLPAARLLVPLLAVAQAAVATSLGGIGALAVFVLPLAILASVVMSTRTALFFKREVAREKLKEMWEVYSNNTVARYALQLGLVGLLFWPFAPIALLCGAVGLSRVDPNGKPPVGRKGSAIAGIVCGALGSIALVVFIVINVGKL